MIIIWECWTTVANDKRHFENERAKNAKMFDEIQLHFLLGVVQKKISCRSRKMLKNERNFENEA